MNEILTQNVFDIIAKEYETVMSKSLNEEQIKTINDDYKFWYNVKNENHDWLQRIDFDVFLNQMKQIIGN